MSRQHLDAVAMGILMACCAAWGVNQVAIKISNSGITPILGAGLRSLVATLFLMTWCRIQGVRLFNRDGSLGHGIVIGLLFAGEFVFLYGGLVFTTASHSVIFLYTAPFFVAVGAHLFLPDEPLRAGKVIGLALAFAGLWLAVADGLSFPTRRELLGDLLELIAALMWAATTVVIKRRTDLRLTPQKTLFYQLAFSAVVLIAQDRLRLTGDGRIRLRLKTPWADGTRHLLFEPLEFLEKLAALIPRAHVNLVLYHGVLASHARWRRRVVLREPTAPSAPNLASAPDPSDGSPPAPGSRHWAWAQLMQRAFGVDVLACPRCAGRLRLVATVEDPHAIRAILESLGLPAPASPPDPP